MPPDPSFDDVPENAGCAEPAKTRLLISGGVLLGAMVVAGITERRTRRGSLRRDTQWLSSSSAKASARRRAQGSASRPRSAAPEVDARSSSARSLPSTKR